jgi:transaldolase
MVLRSPSPSKPIAYVAKDPEASGVLYVRALVAPYTVNTMPEKTLLALADHGQVGAPLAIGGGDAEEAIARHARAGVDVDARAAQLQEEGAKAFAKSWNEMLARITQKTAAAGKA